MPRYFIGHQIGDNSLRGDHEEEGRKPAVVGGSSSQLHLNLDLGISGRFRKGEMTIMLPQLPAPDGHQVDHDDPRHPINSEPVATDKPLIHNSAFPFLL